MKETVQTAVVGVTGYAGAELARLLLRHPRLKGKPPVFAGRVDEKDAARGGVPLAESSTYQTVAKEIPQKVSGMTFVRPDEQARLSYDMIKSGQFEKALLQGMAAGRGGQAPPELPKIINADKLPDFSVFAKYLTLGGSYSVADEDGLLSTGFTLRKNNP